jgi:hypothetical protein
MDQELARAVGRIEGKLDSLHEDFQEHRADHRMSDSRIDKLEAVKKP